MSLCEWCREGPAYRFVVPPYGVEEYELCAACMKVLIASVARRPPAVTLENLRATAEELTGASVPEGSPVVADRDVEPPSVAS